MQFWSVVFRVSKLLQYIGQLIFVEFDLFFFGYQDFSCKYGFDDVGVQKFSVGDIYGWNFSIEKFENVFFDGFFFQIWFVFSYFVDLGSYVIKSLWFCILFNIGGIKF